MPTLRRDDAVFVLELHDAQNPESRFHPHWIAAVMAHLDTVANTEGPRALVTVGGDKFFSNGLDLDWLDGHGGLTGPAFVPYVVQTQLMLARLMSLPMPTVAAVSGHAFAAGAMFALAHDTVVMRADRGYFCLPEVELGIPFSRGMIGLIRARLPGAAARQAMLTGRRYGGDEALLAGIVDAIADADKVLSTALGLARPAAGRAGATLGVIKERLYAAALADLRDTEHPVD